MFKFILRKKINNLLDKSKHEPVFRNWESLRTILILFETSEYDDADIFIEYLKKSGKQVFACGYVIKGDNYDYSETPYRMLFPKVDAGKIGQPSSQLIIDLNTGAYDAIIDLTLKENLTMEYLLLSLSAPLKVGLKKNELPCYDFSISVSQETLGEDKTLSVAYLGKQILHYLKTIRMDDNR